MIHDAQQRGVITGVKITSSLFLTHLLFVDDVLLFGEAIVDEWQQYKQLLDLFCSATGMQINEEKSILLFNDIDELAKANIGAILPYKMEPVSEGFKYLGFYLKPLGYYVKDWRWFIRRFEHRINNWTHRLLSLGGRLSWLKRFSWDLRSTG